MNNNFFGKTYYKIIDKIAFYNEKDLIIGKLIPNAKNFDFKEEAEIISKGLTFYDLEEILKRMYWCNDALICEVIIPLNIAINKYDKVYTTTCALIKNPLEISDFIIKHNLQYKAVNEEGLNLKYIKKQNLSMCIIALKNNVNSLKYVSKDFANIIFFLHEHNLFTKFQKHKKIIISKL